MKRKKRPKFELPRGLREFEYAIDDVEVAERLLPRLLHLPNSGLLEDLDDFNKSMKAVQDAEWAAYQARQAARLKAHGMWGKAFNRYTVKQLQDATGYDAE